MVAQKVQQFFELHELCTELALAGIRLPHPDASPAEQWTLLNQRLQLFREGKWRGSR